MKYLFKIITRADSELIKRVYSAQKQNPSKGYFINLVKTDFEFIGVTLVEAKFCQMKQAQLKIFIHNKILQFLKNSKHSKSHTQRSVTFHTKSSQFKLISSAETSPRLIVTCLWYSGLIH